MENSVSKFDVVIAGGGLSGALSALSLSQLKKNNGEPLSIAIVEANPIQTDAQLTFDSRVLALSHGSASFLKQIGVWKLLNNDAAPIKKIHISDRGYYGKARLTAEEHHVDALGYVVEMSLIGKALINSLSNCSNISWYTPNSISKLEWSVEKVDATLDSSEIISGRLLLACDGANSVCRSLANIDTSTKHYEQSALIANVRMKKPHRHCAYERFTETGPIAMLPLTDNDTDSRRCSLVWTLPPEQAESVLALSDAKFNAKLEHAFGSWFGGVEHVGKRFVYPLSLVQAQQQVSHRMVLMGNAAHTIHPIAGQGFNLGLRDVEQLVYRLEKALAHGQDIGQLNLLTEYAQQRKVDHTHVINITDSIVMLFSNQLLPLVAGRNIGLKVMNYVKPIQNKLVNKLMGY